MKVNIHNRVWLIFLALSVVIGSIWFKDGSLIASGESGLLLYDAYRSLNLSRHLWLETGTGILMPVYFARIPMLVFMLLLQSFLSSPSSQLVLYMLLIFSGTSGMYYLCSVLVQKNKVPISLVASLFYFF